MRKITSWILVLAMVFGSAPLMLGLVSESASATTWETAFFENFETTDWSGNWSVGDEHSSNGYDYWGQSSYRSYSGSYSAYCAEESDITGQYYDNYMEAYMERVADLSTYDYAYLKYYYWLDMYHSSDYLRVQASTDGSYWSTLSTHYYDTYGWSYNNISLNDYCGESTVYIRFYFYSNYYGTSEGAYVDDIELRGSYELVSTDKKYYAPGEDVKISVRGAPNTEVTLNVTEYYGSVYGEHTISVYFESEDIWESMSYEVVGDYYSYVYFYDGESAQGGSQGVIYVYNDYSYSQTISVYIDGNLIGSDYVWSWDYGYFYFDENIFPAVAVGEELWNATGTTNGNGYFNTTYTLPNIDVLMKHYRAWTVISDTTGYADFYVVTYESVKTDKTAYAPGESVKITANVYGPEGFKKQPISGADVSINITYFERGYHLFEAKFENGTIYKTNYYLEDMYGYGYVYLNQTSGQASGGPYVSIYVDFGTGWQWANVSVDGKYTGNQSGSGLSYFGYTELSVWKEAMRINNQTTDVDGKYEYTYTLSSEMLPETQYYKIELIRFNETKETCEFTVYTEEYISTDKTAYAPGENVEITARVTGPDPTYPIEGADVSINITKSAGVGLYGEHTIKVYFESENVWESMSYEIVGDYYTSFDFTDGSSESGGSYGAIEVYNDYYYSQYVSVYIDGNEIGSSYIYSWSYGYFYFDEDDFTAGNYTEVYRIDNVTTGADGKYEFVYTLSSDIPKETQYYRVELIRFNETKETSEFTVYVVEYISTDKTAYAPGENVEITARVTGPDPTYPIEGADISINITKLVAGELYGEHTIEVYFESENVWESMTYEVIEDYYTTVYFSDGGYASGASQGEIRVYNDYYYSQYVSVYIDGNEIGRNYISSYYYSYFSFYEDDFTAGNYTEVYRINNVTTTASGVYRFTYTLPNTDVLSDSYRIELIMFGEVVKTCTFTVETEEQILTDKTIYAPGEEVRITAKVTGSNGEMPVQGIDISLNITRAEVTGEIYGEHTIDVYYESSQIWESMSYEVVSDYSTTVYFYNGGSTSGGSNGQIRVYNYYYSQYVSVYIDSNLIGREYVSWYAYFPFDEDDFIGAGEFVEVVRINNVTTNIEGEYDYLYTISENESQCRYRVELIRFNETVYTYYFTVAKLSLTIETNKYAYARGETVTIYYSLTDLKDISPIEGAFIEWKLYTNDEFKEVIGNGTTTSSASLLNKIEVPVPNNAQTGGYKVWMNATYDNYTDETEATLYVGKIKVEVSTDAEVYSAGDFVTVSVDTYVQYSNGYWWYQEYPVSGINIILTVSVLNETGDYEELDEYTKNLVTDANGECQYIFLLDDNLPPNSKYRIGVVASLGNDTVSDSKTVIIKPLPKISLSLELDKESYVTGDPVILTAHTELLGSEGNLTYLYKVYGSESIYYYGQKQLLFSLTTSNNTLTYTIPDDIEGVLRFEVTAISSDGTEATATKQATVTYGKLVMKPDKTMYTAGDKITIDYELVSNLMTTPMLYYEIYDEQTQLHLKSTIPSTNLTGSFSFNISDSPSSSYTIKLWATQNGKTAEASATIQKITGYKLFINLDKNSYQPGANATVYYKIISLSEEPVKELILISYYAMGQTSQFTTMESASSFSFKIPEDTAKGEYMLYVDVRVGTAYLWDLDLFTVNSLPALHSGISPSEGTPDTVFTFTTVYSDSDGDPPEYVRVVIDGIFCEMGLESGNYTTGAVYEYKTKLQAGEHTYKFVTSDGTNVYTTPENPFIVKEEPSPWLANLPGFGIINLVILIIALLALSLTIYLWRTGIKPRTPEERKPKVKEKIVPIEKPEAAPPKEEPPKPEVAPPPPVVFKEAEKTPEVPAMPPTVMKVRCSYCRNILRITAPMKKGAIITCPQCGKKGEVP